MLDAAFRRSGIGGGDVSRLGRAARSPRRRRSASPQALLIEAETGSILFEKQADALVAPASLAKLMTVNVVFDQLSLGNISLDDEYVISVNAWRKGGAPSRGSTMYAALHSRVKVEDLLKGVMIQSANDGCIALAEGIAGNETEFVRMMNDRAREIGLTKSYLHQCRRSARSEDAGHAARTGPVGAPHRSQLSRLLQMVRRTRIHLEQDPPAEPQSAARHRRWRRRHEDRLHQ